MSIGMRRDFRVLMIGPSLESRGGMATVEKQFVERLPRLGVHVEFVPTYNDANKLTKLAIAAQGYVRFRRACSACDAVHVHMASRGSYERKKYFIRHATRMGKPVVIHLHGGEFGVWFDCELSEQKRGEVRALFESVAAVIVLSEEWRDWMVSRGFAVRRLIVMHNGVAVPSQACTPSQRRNILFLGRLNENKSPDVLLRAAQDALRTNPGARLVFGGDGRIERYRELAASLGIADKCDFLGWVDGEGKERLFSEAAIYCLPSKHEGMPMSVLEAMARGLPAVATPVGGVPQVIADGVDGFLVPVDDEAYLSRLLCCLLEDSGLRQRVGAAGREKIKHAFDIENNIERLAHLYEELADVSAGDCSRYARRQL